MSDHHPHSPSALERQELCPGSYKMSVGLPDGDDKYSAEGTDMHKRVATRNVDGLSAADTELVVLCVEELRRFGNDDWHHEVPVTVLDGFETLTEGTADAVKTREGQLIVIDWKFGYKPVTPAESNIQMLAYATGLHQRTGKNVLTVVFQPRLKLRTEGVVDATRAADVLKWIRKTIDACHAPGLTLIPGEKQCQYCRALTSCPAARELDDFVALRPSGELMTPEQIGGLLTYWRDIVKKRGESLEYRAKEMLTAGEDVPGWCLRSKAGAQKVQDAQAVFERATAAGVDPKVLMSIASFPITKLQDAYARVRKEAAGLTLKAAKEEFTETMGDAIQRGPDSIVLAKTHGDDHATD